MCAFISCIYTKTIVMDFAIYCRKWRGSQLVSSTRSRLDTIVGNGEV